MLRILIADDEPLARRALRRLLAPHTDVEIVGEAESVAQAMELIGQLQPALILLDIEFNGADGFDLLAGMADPPRVIFVTAYAEYAVDAFAVEAIDYLLKPVAQPRLDAALDRARRLLAATPKGHDTLELRAPGRLLRCTPGDILAIEAEGDFSRVHVAEQPPLMILRSIGQFEALLPSPPFLRAGRSILINCDRIRSVQTRSRDEARVVLEGMSDPVILGRAAAARLRQALAARL
ncbi:LytR/AlgR family response regulator transcription factor [Ancylobacter rudongensis]|uniref:Two component transcriptional regulator, LytTR family n=1 Tax=Ancylobacter rudongensis TaxID=177413 RepID=A0A1G4SN70_9HYPH|nr:LytTR family DNA-binding domain-containing protein [Ancylobacter rudongensis]SCW70662.1 two component transcriptional regulator, LytTR family [Ancylobacter rudongensis]